MIPPPSSPPPSPTDQPSPVTCPLCEGRSCLQCCEDPMAFLVRPDDPLDYKKLLDDCFVVVDNNAPFFQFRPDQNWSQKQIVRKVIEKMLYERPKSHNVLCATYNKLAGSNPIVELLTSSAWDILLERVGDASMVSLLRHTSIFAPLSQKKHVQVTGCPLCKKASRNETKPQSVKRGLASEIFSGAGKKRKQTDNSNSASKRQQCGSVSSCDSSLNSINCAGSGAGDAIAQLLEGLSEELQRRVSQTEVRLKMFKRPFKWKRGKKR